MSKKFFVALAAVMTLSFVSCTKQDDSDASLPISETTTTQVTATTTKKEVPLDSESSSEDESSDSDNSSDSDSSEDDSVLDSEPSSDKDDSSQDDSEDSSSTSTSTTTTTTTTKAPVTKTSAEFKATSKTVYTTANVALLEKPSSSSSIKIFIKKSETVTVTSASTDGVWYSVTYSGIKGYIPVSGTTTTKPTVTTTTTTTTKKTTTTTTTTADPMAWVHAGGVCHICGKKFSGNDGYVYKPDYRYPDSFLSYTCNSCLATRCTSCGKACNSSNAKKHSCYYYNNKGQSIYICDCWTCYDCDPTSDPQYYTKLARKSEQEMLTLTQQLRKNNGRTQFYVDPQLTAWAQIRAKELATKFAHFRPNGDPGIAIITTYSDRGENIVMAEGTTNGTQLYKSLEKSSGHKGTMLNTDYTAVGIGVYYDPKTGYSYACQLFGGSPKNK